MVTMTTLYGFPWSKSNYIQPHLMDIFKSKWNGLNYVVDVSGLSAQTGPRVCGVWGLSAVIGQQIYIYTHLEQDHYTTIEEVGSKALPTAHLGCLQPLGLRHKGLGEKSRGGK